MKNREFKKMLVATMVGTMTMSMAAGCANQSDSKSAKADTSTVKQERTNKKSIDLDTYNVTVYCKALKAYIDQKPRIDIQEASNGQTYKIPLKGKIQVVEKEQALKDSASGRYIYGLQMQMRQE